MLGSLNLSNFVIDPFTSHAYVDYPSLLQATSTAIIGLNEVLLEGINLHPLNEQRESVFNWRQIGLGTLGLANMLIKLGIKYDTKEALEVVDDIFKNIAKTAIITSLDLAKAKGCFPACTESIKNYIAESDFIKNLDLSDSILEGIREYGLFNSQLLTCAPTGSISTLWEESGGVEPNYAFSYNRRTISLNKEEKVYKVDAKIVKDYRTTTNNNNLPEYFVASQEINPLVRIDMQSTLQKYIDASISSTINLKESVSIKDVYNIYLYAWKRGLKGVTIWRDNCNRTAILSTNSAKETKQNFNQIIPISRKLLGVTTGNTFCKKCACGTLYITVNRDKDGNIVEVFTHTSKGGICQANTNAITRMASMALRSGIKVEEVVDQLRGIKCPACITLKAKGDKLDGISCPDILSKTIEEFSKLDYCIPDTEDSTEVKQDITCPECGSKLIYSQGCVECSCGWSKCS